MKTLRQICAVAVLTLLLSISVFAGQVNCPGAKPPTEELTPTSSITTTVILAIVSLVN